jgi:CheY-like chemotaxis protein
VHGYGKPGWYASISVFDTGEGMDEATCNKVFEPFFTTKEPDKGTGLGMSVVFGIIKQHNGFINVYSEPVIGTTFTILLPLVQSALKEILASEEEIIERGHETILVADDDDSLRDLTEKALRMFGYTVITAKNGSDALARFKERNGRIDLAILDIIMPEKNGKESFDEMIKLNPAVKAIFVSGYTSGILLKKGLIGENLDFIAKPVHIKQLLVKIRKVLDDKPNMSHPPQLCASF